MNKIITKPKELEENPQVAYAGNHYISIPEIDCQSGVVKNLNLISLSNKALVELEGEDNLFKLNFYKNGQLVHVKNLEVAKEEFYIPLFKFYLEDGTVVTNRIYADLKEKGLIFDLMTTVELEVELLFDPRYLNLLRFNSYRVDAQKTVHQDKWLGNPVVNITSAYFSFGIALGGGEGFNFAGEDANGGLRLIVPCRERNCFYISLNSDPDGASTTLIHLRRKGYQKIYEELVNWLKIKTISYPTDKILESRLNENLFFNYFFAIGKDMETDSYLAMTSRSPRYYVSGAFWERDSFLWSFPAIKLIDAKLHSEILREMILRHCKNPGDHAHYIDGTVLYPGFELDEAASYFVVIEKESESFFDEEIIRALEKVLERIEEEYDPITGLYKTFLLPSDDPSDYPFVLIDNAILWRGLKNLKKVYKQKGRKKMVRLLEERLEGIRQGINKYMVQEIDGKKIFTWSTDGKGNYRLYNDPPGNLGLLYHYGFVEKDNTMFKNTVEYYYSSKYEYFFTDAVFGELACDHHPNTPSGLGLCGTILNPLKTREALEWVKKANFDYGILCESFDRNTGEGKTGVGFATGAGYLAYALYLVLCREG